MEFIIEEIDFYSFKIVIIYLNQDRIIFFFLQIAINSYVPVYFIGVHLR